MSPLDWNASSQPRGVSENDQGENSMFRKILMTSPAILASLLALVAATSNVPTEARGRFAQHHPRRAEVLHRDHHLNNRINGDKGHLGGHYGQLRHEDRHIHRQERWDKNHDNGHITRGEQAQLNREENHLNNQIRRDHN